MSAQEYEQARTRVFVVVQSVIAMAIVFAYLALVLSQREIPSDFSFIAGLIIAFFFDEVRSNNTQSKKSILPAG